MNETNQKRLDRINEITDMLDKMVMNKNITMDQRRAYHSLVEERTELSGMLASSEGGQR